MVMVKNIYRKIILVKKELQINATTWDEDFFGIPTWEILEYSKISLEQANAFLGHQTIKVDPLENKQLLHEHGFYYCDTLIIPSCKQGSLLEIYHSDATISKFIDTKRMLEIFNGAFTHGRFHRDFNLSNKAADLRYNNWLKQLMETQQVYGLYWQGILAGFIGYNGGNLILHAVSKKFRGKSLSKYWWSLVCAELLANGQPEIKSSISAANLAALNLYSSLGFSFISSQDIYHRLLR